MYMDAQARPSFNQSLAGTGTIVSTDSIDLLASGDNLGRSGMPLRAIAVLTTALAGATSVQAQLIESDSANLATPTVLASGAVVPVASATLGAKLIDTPMPDTAKRYIGYQYLVVGTASAGNVTAGVVGGTDRNSSTITMNTGF